MNMSILKYIGQTTKEIINDLESAESKFRQLGMEGPPGDAIAVDAPAYQSAKNKAKELASVIARTLA